MAAGESFFHDLLRLVPTPWNGQLLAILLLNAALIGASLAVRLFCGLYKYCGRNAESFLDPRLSAHRSAQFSPRRTPRSRQASTTA